MTYTFKLSRRIARLRAAGLAAATLAVLGCQGADSFEPEGGTPADAVPAGTSDLASASYAGGMPIGLFGLPIEEYGSRFNGATKIIFPKYLLRDLAAIKSRGGKLVLNLAGGERGYKDAAGNFSLSLWKAKVDQFRAVDFESYIDDGTIIGHFLIDEPHDPENWNGKPIPQSTLEEMARYSKARWPRMATIARTWPDYLDNWSGDYQYLDAAWAQYAANRWSDPDAFLQTNVEKARAKGLALVVGMNITKGSPTKGQMSASQVRTYGAALLASSYPCAFMSWEYRSDHLSTSAMRDAMLYLRTLAESRSLKPCRPSSGTITPPSDPDPDPAPEPAASTLPFGLVDTPLDQYSAGWTGVMDEVDPASLPGRLSRAQEHGVALVALLAPAARTRNADGTFSLAKWKAEIDRYRTLSLGKQISGKTLYLHLLVARPRCAGCWGGKPISWATLEEMARYSKSIWPGLPTAAWVLPSALANAKIRWVHLDAGIALYNTKNGDPRTFIASQAARAREAGLGVVAGLNLLNGAGQSSPPLSATQIRDLGTALARESAVCAMMGWSYDAAYLGQTSIRDALASVAAAARSRGAGSCVVN